MTRLKMKQKIKHKFKNAYRLNSTNKKIKIENNILYEVEQKNWIKTLKTFLKLKYSDGIEVDNVKIRVSNKSIGELLSSPYTRWLKENDFDTYTDKMKMLDGLDRIYQNQKNAKKEPLNHPRTDDIVAFKRGYVTVEVSDNSYEVEVLTGIKQNAGELVYDIVNIKKEDSPIGVTPRSGEPSNRTVS